MLDNLERALAHRDSASLERLWEGLEAVRQQALDILGRYGVRRMQTVGRPFDPAQHEAMALAPGDAEGVSSRKSVRVATSATPRCGPRR